MSKNKKFTLNSGVQTNQILTNDDKVCIPRLSSIFLAVIRKNSRRLEGEDFSFILANIWTPLLPNSYGPDG